MWRLNGTRIGLLVAGLLLTAGTAVAQTPKIGVVDLELVVARSPGGQNLRSRLEAFQKEVQAEVDARSEKARDIRQRMADGVNTLSEDKLAELQKELEDQTIAIRRYRDDKQRQGEKMQSEGLREIEKQLEPVFTRIRDEDGYDLILNNVPGVVVMISDAVNITPLVLERLEALGGS